MSLYRQEPIKIRYNKQSLVAKGTVVDIETLVCYVILQDHMIKGLCDLIGRSPSRQVIILPSLMAIDTVVVEIK